MAPIIILHARSLADMWHSMGTEAMWELVITSIAATVTGVTILYCALGLIFKHIR